MIDGNHYIAIFKLYFDFLITEFNFRIFEEKVRGNAFYDVQYRDDGHIVSVSYEKCKTTSGYFYLMPLIGNLLHF